MSMTVLILWGLNAILDSVGQLAFKAAAVDSLKDKKSFELDTNES